MEPWIDWVRRLQAVSETGLAYATDHHDIARYEEVARLAAEVAGQGSGLDTHGAGHPTPKVGVGWFWLDDLPPLSTARTSRDQVELALAHAARPDLPTDFD